MNMLTLNAESLSRDLGIEVPEILVTICKNEIMGLELADIARVLGVGVDEIVEAQTREDYKQIRVLLGAAQAQSMVETDFSWDSIESESLKGLAKHVKQSRDPEFLLRAAAVANKAQRRLSQKSNAILDPSQGAARVPLQLTERIIKKLSANGDLTQITERQISVLDGTAKNPSFQKIDQALGVRTIAQQHKSGDDFDFEDLGLDPYGSD